MLSPPFRQTGEDFLSLCILLRGRPCYCCRWCYGPFVEPLRCVLQFVNCSGIFVCGFCATLQLRHLFQPAMSKLTAEDVQIVQQVFQSVASLSIVGASFVLITSLLYPSLRTFPVSLVPLLSLVDLITVTSYLMSPSSAELAGMVQSGQPSTLCLSQGNLMTWASVASAMWPAGTCGVLQLIIYEMFLAFQLMFYCACWHDKLA
jgi:hypothetical protein